MPDGFQVIKGGEGGPARVGKMTGKGKKTILFDFRPSLSYNLPI
jgi:hypothetical protein